MSEHLQILKQLNNIFKHDFYLVGGFVRDYLSKISTKDYDIACPIEPEKLLDLCEDNNIKAFPTGLQHGTITVLLDQYQLEITCFRKDLENNGRHATVEFTTNMQDDSLRRDFTINALYIDKDGVLYDFHNGQDDLDKNIVKFIGSAEERINEDHLRILRFFRFLANFDKNFKSLNSDLITILNNNAHLIEKLSADRISQEFIKLASKPNCIKSFQGMLRVKNVSKLFNINEDACDKWDNLLDSLITDPFIKLCLIYRNNIRDLRHHKLFNFSNKQKSFSKTCQRSLSDDYTNYGATSFAILYSVEVASFYFYCLFLDNKIDKDELKYLIDKISSNLPIFNVSGNDLIDLDFPQGKSLGEALHIVKMYWLANGYPDKEQCLDFARNINKNCL